MLYQQITMTMCQGLHAFEIVKIKVQHKIAHGNIKISSIVSELT